MHTTGTEAILEKTIRRHPLLSPATEDIRKAFSLLCHCFANHNKLLACGNGGSASD